MTNIYQDFDDYITPFKKEIQLLQQEITKLQQINQIQSEQLKKYKEEESKSES